DGADVHRVLRAVDPAGAVGGEQVGGRRRGRARIEVEVALADEVAPPQHRGRRARHPHVAIDVEADLGAAVDEVDARHLTDLHAGQLHGVADVEAGDVAEGAGEVVARGEREPLDAHRDADGDAARDDEERGEREEPADHGLVTWHGVASMNSEQRLSRTPPWRAAISVPPGPGRRMASPVRPKNWSIMRNTSGNCGTRS